MSYNNLNKDGDYMKLKDVLIKISIVFILVLIVLLIFEGPRFFRKMSRNDGVPVLAYHDIVSEDEKSDKYKYNVWVMEEENFEEQMKYLSENGYYALSMQEYIDWKVNGKSIPDKSVLITFDDGFYSIKSKVEPIMKKYNLRCSVFVITNKLSEKNERYLHTEDIVSSKYIEYYSHTDNYHKKDGKPYLQIKSYKQINNDLATSFKKVSNLSFAYPYGASSNTAIKVLKDNGVKVAFTIGENCNSIQDDNDYEIPRYAMLSFYSTFTLKYFVN